MEFILKKHRQSYKQELDQTTLDIEDKIESLQKKLKELVALSKASRKAKKTTLEKTTPPKQSTSKPTATNQSATKAELPKPGKIIEQNIQ